MSERDLIEWLRKPLSQTARYNLRVAPIVIFVRVPLLLPFWLIAHVGRAAEGAGNWIDRHIPGFRP